MNFLVRPRLGRAELRLDRQTPYRIGEPIHISVRFPEDAAPPKADVPVQVSVEVTSPSGEIETSHLRLGRIEGSRGAYEAMLTRTSVGTYRFRLASPPSPRSAPETTARVLPPPGELDNLKLNRGDLERAALLSRGRYYDLADASRLPEEMPAVAHVSLHQPRPPYALWSHPATFIVGLSLIGFEWILRKRRSLL